MVGSAGSLVQLLRTGEPVATGRTLTGMLWEGASPWVLAVLVPLHPRLFQPGRIVMRIVTGSTCVSKLPPHASYGLSVCAPAFLLKTQSRMVMESGNRAFGKSLGKAEYS